MGSFYVLLVKLTFHAYSIADSQLRRVLDSMPLLSSRYALTHLLMSFVDGELFQVFLGQVIGTSAGTHIDLKHGWRAGAGLSLGLVSCMFFILIVRGPHTTQYRWFGCEGGMEWRKEVVQETALVNDMMGDGSPPSSDDNSKADIQEVVKDAPLRAEERGTDRRAKDQPNLLTMNNCMNITRMVRHHY